MKIKDVFAKEKKVKIDYLFTNQCPCCNKLYSFADLEYSFDGDLDYFVGDWSREYGVMDLDDEVQFDISRYAYVFDCPFYDEVICPDCENIEND